MSQCKTDATVSPRPQDAALVMNDQRQYPGHPILAVSALIHNPEFQILIVRRAKKPGRGLWSLPGGAVRLGESVKDALAREVMEECSVDIILEELLDVHDHIIRDDNQKIKHHFLIVNYRCKLPKNAHLVPATDVDQLCWLSPSKLDQFNYTAGVKPVLRKYFKNAERLEQRA